MKNPQNRSFIRCFAAALVLLPVLAGCSGDGKPQQTTAPAPTQPATTEYSEPADTEYVQPTAPEETQGIAVDNVYMTFFYPQEWEGKVEEIRQESGNNITVTFRTEISGREVVLFSVVMGPDQAEGYLLGQLQDSQAGTINVYSLMYEQDPAQWSQEDYDAICALQERVNDIIVQFYEDQRFVPIR